MKYAVRVARREITVTAIEGQATAQCLFLEVSQNVVIPAQANIQSIFNLLKCLDSGFRGNDETIPSGNFCEYIILEFSKTIVSTQDLICFSLVSPGIQSAEHNRDDNDSIASLTTIIPNKFKVRTETRVNEW